MTMHNMNAMFNPGTVAVIGASEEEGSVGRAILENLITPGGRRIFPVNPRKESAFGLTCYPSVADLPEPVDLAVIATPAKTVPEVVEECARADTQGVVIVSSGFKEVGAEGRLLEEQILEVRRKYGIRIVGPNCIGVIRPHSGLNASFIKGNPEPGNIAFISQSGALGGAILDWAIRAHVGFSMFASLGSMTDMDFGDFIDFLGSDRHTRSIMLYMEGVGNARKFMSAARGFARSKPIVIVKPGRFPESAKAALSHTGALAGDDKVYDAAFKRAGVIRVREFSDLFNAASVLDSNYLPKGRKLAIVTNAGGFGVMATDMVIDLRGELSKLSDETTDQLDAILPPFWSKGNPVDVLGDADCERYTAALKICLADREVDGLLAIYGPQAILNAEDLAKSIVEIARNSRKPIVATFVGGDAVEKAKDLLLKNSVPTYDTPEDAVKTYLYMYRYHRNLTLLYEAPSELTVRQAPSKNHLKVLLRRVAREGRTLLTEGESKDFLVNYDIPRTVPYLAQDVEGAIAAARRIGYPVVLKILSPDISHKTDVGGVRVGIHSDDELRSEYAQLFTMVKLNAPEAAIQGVTVQKMIERIDYEIILGAKKDKDFGTIILFGMGGVGTEVFRDVAIGLPPLNQTLARRLMEETEVYKMLKGYRGKAPADMKSLEQILVSFSNLIVDFPEIAEMDINPIAIAEGRACSLDARIVIDRDAMDYTTQYPHLVITPYPARYVIAYELPDGTPITLRPIKPEDEALEHEMLSTLKPETMRTRFFSVISDISHEMLVRFCNIDYEREMAIVAEVRGEDRKRIVGIGRLIVDPDFREAEYAVLVHDDFQGKGLGYKLVDVLIGVAQDMGLEGIHGTVLSENDKMLRIALKLGFTMRREEDGETTSVRLTLT